MVTENGLRSSVSTHGPGESVSYAEMVLENVSPDGHDPVAAPAEQVPDRDADDDHDQGGVEDEVAGLAQVAALAAEGVRVLTVGALADAEAPAPQGLPGGLHGLLDGGLDLQLGVLGQPLEAPRGARRLGAQGLPVDP